MSLAHWESYYRGGAIATCPTGADTTYTAELRDVWRNFFAPLHQNAHILDVGTGNGAIALIAAELSRELQRQWRITGTDLAQIDPPSGAAAIPRRSDVAGRAGCGCKATRYARSDALGAPAARSRRSRA